MSRILFLDDDPDRGFAFLDARPDAVWVQTVEECVQALSEPWDEVHLDHDLGGEVHVDIDREDCGMAVIRWICDTPRPHLNGTQFYVHTHNANAACVMSLHLEVSGYKVKTRPFNVRDPVGELRNEPPPSPGFVQRVLSWFQIGP